MVLLPGLRLSSLTVHGFCSLHLGCPHQPEGVHLNEGLSCGVKGGCRLMITISTISFLLLRFSLVFLSVVFNFYFCGYAILF